MGFQQKKVTSSISLILLLTYPLKELQKVDQNQLPNILIMKIIRKLKGLTWESQ